MYAEDYPFVVCEDPRCCPDRTARGTAHFDLDRDGLSSRMAALMRRLALEALDNAGQPTMFKGPTQHEIRALKEAYVLSSAQAETERRATLAASQASSSSDHWTPPPVEPARSVTEIYQLRRSSDLVPPGPKKSKSRSAAPRTNRKTRQERGAEELDPQGCEPAPGPEAPVPGPEIPAPGPGASAAVSSESEYSVVGYVSESDSEGAEEI